MASRGYASLRPGAEAGARISAFEDFFNLFFFYRLSVSCLYTVSVPAWVFADRGKVHISRGKREQG